VRYSSNAHPLCPNCQHLETERYSATRAGMRVFTCESGFTRAAENDMAHWIYARQVRLLSLLPKIALSTAGWRWCSHVGQQKQGQWSGGKGSKVTGSETASGKSFTKKQFKSI
jgi:hypothetical protein